MRRVHFHFQMLPFVVCSEASQKPSEVEPLNQNIARCLVAQVNIDVAIELAALMTSVCPI